jgi:hypothetical protein
MNDQTPVSILDLVGRVPVRERKPIDSPFTPKSSPPPFPSVTQLAYSEPHPSGIAAHVFEAHEAAKAKSYASGSATVQVSVNMYTGALELIPESKTVLEALQALGAEAKITIKW